MRAAPEQVLVASDLIAVHADAAAIETLQPDFTPLKRLVRRGVIAIAPGRDTDIVSGFFAPGLGNDQDPLTCLRAI